MAVLTSVLGIHAGEAIHTDARAVLVVGRERQQLDTGARQRFLAFRGQASEGIQ